MPMFRKFNKDFFKTWSKEMAYVLGYTFADGAVYTNFRGSCYLEFTSTDRELIYKVRKLLASEHKITLKKRSAKNPNWKNDRNIFAWSFISHFTSGSKAFLVGLKNVLKENLSGGCLSRKSDGSYSLAFSRQDSVALFKLMYHNTLSEMFLERKYNTFLEAFRILKYEVAGVA